MKSEHIIDLLDNARHDALSLPEQAMVQAHIANCGDCKRAFDAAVACTSILKARMAETIEPSPFFATRVMAALREKRRDLEPLSLRNLWRTARGLVTAMAAIVLLLGGLTVANTFDQSGSAPYQTVAVSDPSNEERVVFQDEYQNASYDSTNNQVYQTVLGPENSDAEY